MCGATQEQKDLQAQQATFYKDLSENYKLVFGKQQAILDELTKVTQPVIDAGPSQRGFSDDQRNLMETASTENVAHNFANAKQTLQESLAARGGSDFLPSGGDVELGAQIDAMGAEDRSSQQNQIEQADWNQGRQNYTQAVGLLGGVASELNPIGTANSATGAGEAAGTTANQIAQASNSMWSAAIGGLSGIAGQGVGGWAKGHFGA